MAKLSPEQIAVLVLQNGIPENMAATAVAIALAESGGDTNSHNTTPPDNSYGLWQINMYGSLGPSRRRELGIANNDALFDPNVNARAMKRYSNNGQNWRPWSTYPTRYLTHLNRANQAVRNARNGVTEQPPPLEHGDGLQIPNPFSNLETALKTITNPQAWRRASYFVIGGVMVGMAVIRIAGKA